METFDIGEMNKEVQWLMKVSSRNQTGETINNWVTSNTIWAKVEYKELGSDENEIVKRKTDRTKVIFTMYLNKAADPDWRLLFNSNEYEILSILPESDKMFMKVEANRFETNAI